MQLDDGALSELKSFTRREEYRKQPDSVAIGGSGKHARDQLFGPLRGLEQEARADGSVRDLDEGLGLGLGLG